MIEPPESWTEEEKRGYLRSHGFRHPAEALGVTDDPEICPVCAWQRGYAAGYRKAEQDISRVPL